MPVKFDAVLPNKVEVAGSRIRPYVRLTPLLHTDVNGRPIVLKPENPELSGSFKFGRSLPSAGPVMGAAYRARLASHPGAGPNMVTAKAIRRSRGGCSR